MTRRSRAERFDTWRKRNATLVILVFTALVISAVITISGAVGRAFHWYSETFQWRSREFERLTSLKAGFSIDQFRQRLGSPIFRRVSEDDDLTEYSFQGRDYWVQAVVDDAGTVSQYAVTSCSDQFRPLFRVPGEGRVRLHEGTFASITRTFMASMSVDPIFHAIVPGATANIQVFDQYYGGNPSNYQSFAWGINDGCEDGGHLVNALHDDGLLPFDEGFDFLVPAARGSASVRRFRDRVAVNTYAETAPFVDFENIGTHFQIGIDRILTRTTL